MDPVKLLHGTGRRLNEAVAGFATIQSLDVFLIERKSFKSESCGGC